MNHSKAFWNEVEKVGDYAYKLKLNRGYIELSVNV